MKSFEHKTNLIFNIFFCIIIMPLLVILGPAKYWWSISPVFSCLSIAYLYGCYFAINMLNVPQLILSRSYYKIGSLSIVLIILTYLLTLYPLPEMDFVIPSMSEYLTRVRDYNTSLTVWLMFVAVIGYSLTEIFIKDLYYRRLQQSIAENQRDKAKLALYKAQINPHFLFNTLNSIYSLIVGTSQKAEDAFIKFTELLKYTYIISNNDRVTIAEEIDYIDNYIDLQLIRLDNHTDVVRDYSVDDLSANIPPMLFLTFVENVFKYGASTSVDSNILIRLHLKNGLLFFETQNKIVKHSDEFREDMPIGLDNCRNRLDVLYPDNYSLNIKEETETFNVELRINLQSNDRLYKMYSN